MAYATVDPMKTSIRFHVARQDSQVRALTWFLHTVPRNPRAWGWTDDPDQAVSLKVSLNEIDAHRLAVQYNQRPVEVRRGTVAKVIPA